MVPRHASRRARPWSVAAVALLVSGLLACRSTPRARADAVEPTERVEVVDLGGHFAGIEATFVVLQPGRALRQVHDPERAARRFIPASTFKIPNSLIALETGVADGPDFAIPWNQEAAPPASWWPRSWRRDQVLRTAFQNSVFWSYQELARRIGEPRMRQHLRRFAYGNEDIGGGLDQFWLHGDLRISADEQVAFLERFYTGRLGLSESTTQLVKEMMVLADGGSYRLSGKTGTAEVTATRELGWLVGFVELETEVAFFALNIEGERVWEDWPPRRRGELVRRLLAELDVIDAPPASDDAGGAMVATPAVPPPPGPAGKAGASVEHRHPE